MKTSKQEIQDQLSQLAADIEVIKAMLDGGAAGAGVPGQHQPTYTAAIDCAAISNGVANTNIPTESLQR